jgi:hypothetical protein
VAAVDAASGEGSLATGARYEGQAKAVIAQPAEPSVEAEKNSPAGKSGRDHAVGDSSVAVEFDGAAIDPLREALATLDDRDYATAQRLFTAIGRKDVAEAIKDALAALDRKDYPMAQGLFEALGQKGAAAAQVKGSAPASPASPKPAAWAGGSVASDSRNKARQNPSHRRSKLFRLRMRRIARLCLSQRRQNPAALSRFYLEQAWRYLRSSAYLLFIIRH